MLNKCNFTIAKLGGVADAAQRSEGEAEGVE